MYHFYYGDETGSPGSILTFFPFAGIQKGRKGKGQMTVTGFSIPSDSIAYWLTQLTRLRIAHEEAQEQFNETYMQLQDLDGLGIELVANDQDKRKGFTYGHIPLEQSIRGFYQATLSLEGGVLFEIATNPPGFAIDEEPAHLGEAIKLPFMV